MISNNQKDKTNSKNVDNFNLTVSNFSNKKTQDENLFQNNLGKNKNNLNFPAETNPHFKDSIKLNNRNTSLRMAIETLDLIPENEDNNLLYGKINNTNLFKNLKDEKNKNDNKYLEEINSFNETILKNSSWGNSNMKTNNKDESQINYPIKPDKREIEKEVGKSVYNTKLPRNRMLTKALQNQNMNASSISFSSKGLALFSRTSQNKSNLLNSSNLNFGNSTVIGKNSNLLGVNDNFNSIKK